MQFLTAHDVAQIELPEFAREAERGPMLIQIGDEFQTKRTPEVCQAHVSADRLQLNGGVKRKGSALGHKAGEGVTVEVIAMRWIGGPVGI